MAEVKVPKLLHKMSAAAQKAWYKKHGMTMPKERSAAQAKKIKPVESKPAAVAAASDKPKTTREINAERQKAYYAKGGRAPIGAGGSGGSNSMAGAGQSTIKDIKAGIKAGFNPKVSLDPYESEKAKKVGPRSLKLRKESVEKKEEPPFTPDKKVVRRGPGGPMSQAKWLAKQAMMKKMKELKKEEVEVTEAVKDAADVGEYDYEGDMAKSQLRSILANAKRMHDMLEENTNLPEWVQSKVTLAEDYILTAANYMEGEMNEELIRQEESIFEAMKKMEMDDEKEDDEMEDEDDEMEDDEEEDKKKKMDEKAPPGAKFERMVKHIKKGYAKDGLTKQEKSIAYATAWKAYGKKNEEVEQIDEQSPAEIKAKYYHDQFDKVKPVKAYDKEGKLVGHYRSMAHAKQMKPGHTYKMAEEVVTEAEGSIPTTPKEKALAAHHGDKTRITFGDVLKARLKSAAAKKMGNK